MGDYYDFETKIIGGKEVSGFVYKNESTGWNEIFVQMTDEQCEIANNFEDRFNKIKEEMRDYIKSVVDSH